MVSLTQKLLTNGDFLQGKNQFSATKPHRSRNSTNGQARCLGVDDQHKQELRWGSGDVLCHDALVCSPFKLMGLLLKYYSFQLCLFMSLVCIHVCVWVCMHFLMYFFVNFSILVWLGFLRVFFCLFFKRKKEACCWTGRELGRLRMRDREQWSWYIMRENFLSKKRLLVENMKRLKDTGRLNSRSRKKDHWPQPSLLHPRVQGAINVCKSITSTHHIRRMKEITRSSQCMQKRSLTKLNIWIFMRKVMQRLGMEGAHPNLIKPTDNRPMISILVDWEKN